MEAGADSTGKKGELCPFHQAAQNGYDRIVKLILTESRKYVDEEDCWVLKRVWLHADYMSDEGFTALHLAAARGHLAVLEVLFERKVDVNCRSQNALQYGSSALHLAASNGQLEVVKFLLARGAKPEMYRASNWFCSWFSNGSSPLWLAAIHGHADVVETLLQAGVKELLLDSLTARLLLNKALWKAQRENNKEKVAEYTKIFELLNIQFSQAVGLHCPHNDLISGMVQ